MDQAPAANVGSWLRDRAALHPERTAVRVAGGAAQSYRQLNELANRSAAALASLGVRPGDRVALALESDPIYLALYFGAAKLGAVLLPLNTRLTRPELAFQLDDADPRAVLVSPGAAITPGTQGERRILAVDDFRADLPEAAPEPELAPGGEAPQVIMYTSGTTGRARGAVLPHRKTVCNTLNAERFLGLGGGDVVIVPVPLFHSYGLKILSVPALFCGAEIVLVQKFDPVGLQELVAERAATVLAGVPVMHQRMVRAGLRREALATLRYAFTAGAPIDADTVRAFDGAGVPLVQGYGQTETSILCCQGPGDSLRKVGSVGRPVGHCELRIGDERGEPVPPGETGEILVRGGIVMSGYWRRPEDTAAATLAGWHRTGDLAVQDAEGYVTLVGRLKELYISGGENVYPAEVERVLLEHPNVAECAVLGVPDPEWGEAGHAYVVARQPPLDSADLRAFCSERLAGYKRPREIHAVDALPRTASGKVQKHLLAPR